MPDFIQPSNLTVPDATWVVRRKERIPVPPERVWCALTEPSELSKWWCTEARVDLKPQGLYSFNGPYVFGDRDFESSDNDKLHKPGNFEILELVEGERLSFRWWLGDVESRVTYILSNMLEITELTVTQTANQSPAWDMDSRTPNWWWMALPSLRSYIENGQSDLRIDFGSIEQAREIKFQVNIFTFPWVIWKKLTDPVELNRWIASNAEIELVAGGKFDFGFNKIGPHKVIDIEEGQRLLHDWLWGDGACSTVEWTLQDTDDATLVSVKDCGPWDPGARKDFLAIHWAAHLLNLKQMSQRGITPREYQN